MRRVAVLALAMFVIPVADLCPGAFAQFETRSSFLIPGTTDPYSLLVGDFNGDGIPDLAVLNSVQNTTGSVEIWLGNGNGTFRQGGSYAVPHEAFYGAVADLRGNGLLDLVLAGSGGYAIYILPGDGDGTFQPSVSYPTGSDAIMVASGDFTVSGHTDVVALEGVGCNCLEVFPGNGDGTLGPRSRRRSPLTWPDTRSPSVISTMTASWTPQFPARATHRGSHHARQR